jgi:pimeloyl-ACP methyl ester carboxylesterase
MPTGYREHHYTSQDGLRLYYRSYGDPLAPRTAVLCLGGMTRNAADFDDLANHLAGERWVLCPDYRGRGRSEYDPDWRHYIPATYVDDIRHLLVAAGVHRVAVIGTSMGGLLATAMGVVMPSALSGIVMNDVGPDLDSEGTGRIIDYISKDRPQPDWATAIGHLKKGMPFLSFRTERDWRRFAEGTYREGGDGLLHFDWDIDIVRPLLTPQEPAHDLWQYFRAVRRIPLLVVRGGISDVLSAETLTQMESGHAAMRSITIPGVGHAPSLNEAAAVEAIDDFLAAI